MIMKIKKRSGFVCNANDVVDVYVQIVLHNQFGCRTIVGGLSYKRAAFDDTFRTSGVKSQVRKFSLVHWYRLETGDKRREIRSRPGQRAGAFVEKLEVS